MCLKLYVDFSSASRLHQCRYMFTHVYFGEHFVFLHFFFLFIRLCLILRQWTTKHPNMKTQEGEDIDKPFIEKDWIGRGKIYNRTTLPAFVTIAMSDIVEIPRNIASNQLPAANEHIRPSMPQPVFELN